VLVGRNSMPPSKILGDPWKGVFAEGRRFKQIMWGSAVRAVAADWGSTQGAFEKNLIVPDTYPALGLALWFLPGGHTSGSKV